MIIVSDDQSTFIIAGRKGEKFVISPFKEINSETVKYRVLWSDTDPRRFAVTLATCPTKADAKAILAAIQGRLIEGMDRFAVPDTSLELA